MFKHKTHLYIFSISHIYYTLSNMLQSTQKSCKIKKNKRIQKHKSFQINNKFIYLLSFSATEGKRGQSW